MLSNGGEEDKCLQDDAYLCIKQSIYNDSFDWEISDVLKMNELNTRVYEKPNQIIYGRS